MKSVFNFFGEVAKIVIVALLIVVPIRTFLVQPFFVKGESMAPAFQDQEYLLIDEFSYRLGEPRRGDVVVFHYPNDKRQYYIKRVVGLPGERVKAENNQVKIYSREHLAGLVLDEQAYVSGETPGNFDVTLKANEYFVLGDNRNRSYDSRSWGALDRALIVGKVWLVVWPFPRAQAFSPPNYD